MKKTLLAGETIQQIAYFVPDMRAAARRHSELFGSGPFFAIDHLPMENCVHRGKAVEFDHSACLGQWGDITVEFSQQHNPGPSYYRDLYPEGSGRYGFHHVGIIVEDIARAIRTFADDGLQVIFSGEGYGIPIIFIDAVERYGHFIELYPNSIGWIFETVKQAAGQFDKGLFREFAIPAA